MNILFIRQRSPQSLTRFVSRWPSLSQRFAAPPRSLLLLAARYPATWGKRVIDLEHDPIQPSELASADAAVLSETVPRGAGLRQFVKRCSHATIGWIIRRSNASQPLLPLDEGRAHTSEEIPRWDLANPADYSSVSIPLSNAVRPSDSNGSCPVRVCRSPESLIAELECLAVAGWTQPIVLNTGTLRAKDINLGTLLQAVARWPNPLRARQLQAEVALEDATDDDFMDQLLAAGIRDIMLVLPIGGREYPELKNERTFVAFLKELQRRGIQVRSGMPVRDPSASWLGFVRNTVRLHSAGLDRSLSQLLGAPLLQPRAVAALAAARCAGLKASKLVRPIGSALHRMSGMHLNLLPLLLTLAACSELQCTADGLR